MARGLTTSQAAKVNRERDGAISFVTDRTYGSFRAFELRQLDAKMRPKPVIGATVPATENAALDHVAAEKLIDIQVIGRCNEFCGLSALKALPLTSG
jgi:hypothetical protein